MFQAKGVSSITRLWLRKGKPRWPSLSPSHWRIPKCSREPITAPHNNNNNNNNNNDNDNDNDNDDDDDDDDDADDDDDDDDDDNDNNNNFI